MSSPSVKLTFILGLSTEHFFHLQFCLDLIKPYINILAKVM